MAPHTIAVAGKGGVGKTTTCGMIIDYLCAKKRGPVLVVDADANSNLNEVLGVEVETSLGQIREEMAQAELKGTIPKGMTKADYAEMKFGDALIEDDDFDMLVMGRTQLLLLCQRRAAISAWQVSAQLFLRGHGQRGGAGAYRPGDAPPCGHHASDFRLLPPGRSGRGENRRNDRRDGFEPRTTASVPRSKSTVSSSSAFCLTTRRFTAATATAIRPRSSRTATP